MYHFIITFAFIVVLATVGSGILMNKSPAGIKLPSGKTLTYTSVAMSMILLAMFIVTFAPGAVKAATDIGSGNGLAYIAAGISTGLACLGAGFAVASVGGCGARRIDGRSENNGQNAHLCRLGRRDCHLRIDYLEYDHYGSLINQQTKMRTNGWKRYYEIFF
jgi:F0F1-type ATP synthase membrane subunit c/vacuolar-type H+-ATPase subunit K